MELSSTQVKALATVARRELTDEEAVAAYLSLPSTNPVITDPPLRKAPGRPKVSVKRAAKVVAAPKAAVKRDRKTGGDSNVTRVYEDLKEHPHSKASEIQTRTGLDGRQVSAVLQQLKKADKAEGVGNKRNTTWTAK